MYFVYDFCFLNYTRLIRSISVEVCSVCGVGCQTFSFNKLRVVRRINVSVAFLTLLNTYHLKLNEPKKEVIQKIQ